MKACCSYLLGHFRALCPGSLHFPHNRFGGGTALLGDAGFEREGGTLATGMVNLLAGFD